jgi:hypothetical protein
VRSTELSTTKFMARGDTAAGADGSERQSQRGRREAQPEENQGQSAESRDKVAPYQSAEGSVSSQNDCPDPRSDCKRKRQRKKQQSRANRGQPSETLKREAQDKDETVHRDVAVKPPRVLTRLEGTALRPNFIARRAHSNLLVLVRNKHPPAAAHDGKGLGYEGTTPNVSAYTRFPDEAAPHWEGAVKSALRQPAARPPQWRQVTGKSY